MQKLVSKNPILRFKQGKKIVKAEEGAVARWQRRIKSGINGIGSAFKGAFDMTFNPNNTLFGSLKIYNFSRTVPSRIINSLVVDNYTPENGGTTNNRLKNQLLNNLNIAKQNTYKTPELKGSKEAYLNRLKLLGFTAKPTKPIVKTTPIVKKQSVVPRSGWSYGYDRSNEISDIRAIQQMLKNAGFNIGKYGVDGRWGKDTEKAYKLYLALKNVPTYEKPEMPSVAEMAGIYSLENKPLYLQIRFKQGGQLVSRNPITRFKNKKK